MKKIIEKAYRLIPHGYAKSILKNILSYIIFSSTFQKENIEIDGVKIKVYKDKLFNNKELSKEILGYNKKYKLQKNTTVIDAGAYTGVFTIYAANKIGRKGKVIAFEPDPFNFIRLKKNLKLNNIKNVILIKKGLFSKKTFLPIDIQGFGSTIILDQYKNQKAINKAELTTLDCELKRLKISEVDFVKMDIEGAEIEAVKGCENLIRNSKTIHFAIGSYHIVKGENTSKFLEDFFKLRKIKVETGNKKHLTTYADKN